MLALSERIFIEQTAKNPQIGLKNFFKVYNAVLSTIILRHKNEHLEFNAHSRLY
jgi:hypothetical protein